jgi:hypothetical protein
MATPQDPKEHPLHTVPDELPRPPGDLPPAPPPSQPSEGIPQNIPG